VDEESSLIQTSSKDVGKEPVLTGASQNDNIVITITGKSRTIFKMSILPVPSCIKSKFLTCSYGQRGEGFPSP
jgi:hypothetical protein